MQAPEDVLVEPIQFGETPKVDAIVATYQLIVVMPVPEL
jgi:hypothetical protein